MRKNYGPIYVAPIAFWLIAFLSVPLLITLSYSFMEKGLYGGVELKFSLAAYKSLLNTAVLKVLLNTIVIAVASTAIMVALALPTAYYIARSPMKNLLLMLIIIPFWTNFLIRIYAWIAILGSNGLLNSFLLNTGLLDAHIQFLYNRYAIILVIIYTTIPFAIFPLYSTIEKFDFSLIEAAMDLGASKFRALWLVMIPNIRSGITTAILFTFIPTFGNFAVPQLVGGTDSWMLGNLIVRELNITRNWPLASSISVVLTSVTMIGVFLFMRSQSKKEL
ncbi:ABC transporter permease [Candidatus Electronema sp. JM]|uniref:ABC transporter permease n=1 Tax=Candidatus Electronema sp. JM TaxID=3401571 RepID=UPI003AA87D77